LFRLVALLGVAWLQLWDIFLMNSPLASSPQHFRSLRRATVRITLHVRSTVLLHRLVLDAKKLFPGGVIPLIGGSTSTIVLSRRQAACIVSLSLLCAWPALGDKGREMLSWPPANFIVRAYSPLPIN
jgi:hypothetical protein